MGFRTNGQFVCPGCRAAIDKTPEISRAMAAGPVSVVVPKVPPEKRAKQATQQIRLPSKVKEDRPGPKAHKPAMESPRAAAGPGQTAPQIPVPHEQPKVTAVPARADAAKGHEVEEAGGPLASTGKEAKVAAQGEPAIIRPKKEYTKFFPPRTKEQPAPEKPAAVVPTATPRTVEGRDQQIPATAARPAPLEKPQGFPWMVPTRSVKKEELLPQTSPKQIPPSAIEKATLPSVATATTKKKSTDVIPALGGLKKIVPPVAAEVPRQAPVVAPVRAERPLNRVPDERPPTTAASVQEREGKPIEGAEIKPKANDQKPIREEKEAADSGPSWLDGFAKEHVAAIREPEVKPETGDIKSVEGETGNGAPDLASTEKDVSDWVAEEDDRAGESESEPDEGAEPDSADEFTDEALEAAEAEVSEGEQAGAEQAEGGEIWEEDDPGFGPSTLEAAVPHGTSKKGTDRIPQAAAAAAGAGSSQVSARVLRLADVISGAGMRETARGPLGAAWDWIEDHLPLLLVSGLLLTVGATVYGLWRSAEGKAISEVGFRTPADFQTYQKGMALVRRGKIREAAEVIRASAMRVSADHGLRSFYFELRAALGEQPSTSAEITELLKSNETGSATVARILTWESAWHNLDIDGRMRSVKILTKLGLFHRLPLAEREVRRALGDSAEAALGPRPAGLDGYRWDERFVKWYYLKAATGDNGARDRLIQWVRDPQTDRIRREAASLALLELDEPDAEKIVHDIWQQEQTRIEAINFRVTTSRALGIDGGKLPPEEVRRIRDWATKELGFSIARAFGLLYEHGVPAGLELLETTARNDGVYGFPAIAAVAELNRVLGGKALSRMAAIRDYWRSELTKLRSDPKEATSEVGQTFQKVMGRIIEAVTIEMARAGDPEAIKEVTAGLSSENDLDRVQAAFKLGERGLELAMPVLVAIAEGAEKPAASQEERKEAKRILLESGQNSAKAYLAGLLSDPDAAVRFGAASRLLELQVEAQPRAVPPADVAPAKTGQ